MVGFDRPLHRLLNLIGLYATGPVPPPWRPIAFHRVGGLTEVGFAEDGALLLVLSHDGRGVFDCASGEPIARDENPEFPFDASGSCAAGIGALAGQTIEVAGLRGGALPASTHDGWRIGRNPSKPTADQLVVTPPARPPVRLPEFVCELRAFGFSPSGDRLIIATTADLAIYGR